MQPVLQRRRHGRGRHLLAAAMVMLVATLAGCADTGPSTAATWDAMIDERWERISGDTARADSDHFAGKATFDEWAATACSREAFADAVRDRNFAVTGRMDDAEYDELVRVVTFDCGLLPTRPDRPFLVGD